MLDLQVCWMQAQEKPPVTISEFADLAQVIMEEEGLETPATTRECLALYFDLLNNIEH